MNHKPPPSSSRRGPGGPGWAIVVVLLVIAVYFHSVILHPGKVVFSPHSDYLGFLLSRTAFVVNHLFQTGSLPLWRPSELCGIPTLGNPQIGVFYPPNMLSYLVGPLLSLGLRFIVCLFFAAIFTYAYCREIELGFFPALFASLAFMLSGFIATNIYAGHIQHISAIVWLPACLFFMERIVTRRRASDAVGLGVCLTYQFLAGHPQYFFYSAMACGFYFLCAWIPRRRAASLLLAASVPLLFVSLSAIQLFPTLEFISQMTRGSAGYGFASIGSLPPAGLLTFIMPNLFGNLAAGTYWGPNFYWEYCGYAGVSTIVLAAAGAFFARRARARIFLAMAVLSLLFALGKNTPFYYSLCALFPPLLKFRVPSRMLFVYSFSVAVLAGMGLEYLADRGRAGKLFTGALVSFLFLSAGIVLFRLFPGPFCALGRMIVRFKFGLDAGGAHTMSLSEWLDRVPAFYSRLREGVALWPISCALGLFAAVMLVYDRTRLAPGVFSAVVLVFLCVEMLGFDMQFIGAVAADNLHPRTEAIAFLEKDRGLFRMMDLSGRMGLENVEPYGIPTALNFESGFIRWYADFLTLVRFRISPLDSGVSDPGRLNRDFDPPVGRLSSKNTPLDLINLTTRYRVDDFDPVQNGLNLMNVKYIVLNNRIEDPGFELVFSSGGSYIYRNRNVLPRAFAVHALEAIPDRVEAFSRLSVFDPAATVVVPGGRKPRKGEGAFHPVTITDYQADRITCEVEVDRPAYLILSEIWYPGWEAYDNGRKRTIFMANCAFRGISIDAGDHLVEFRYCPFSYRFGMLLSLAGMAASLCMISIKRKGDDR